MIIITAPSIVMDHVVLERDCESTVVFVEGAREAYLGYITIKVGLKALQLNSTVFIRL